MKRSPRPKNRSTQLRGEKKEAHNHRESDSDRAGFRVVGLTDGVTAGYVCYWRCTDWYVAAEVGLGEHLDQVHVDTWLTPSSAVAVLCSHPFLSSVNKRCFIFFFKALHFYLNISHVSPELFLMMKQRTLLWFFTGISKLQEFQEKNIRVFKPRPQGNLRVTPIRAWLDIILLAQLPHS